MNTRDNITFTLTVSCVLNVVSVSGLFIGDCTFGFL